MERKQIKLGDWPFEKGEKVQLIWIGEPFKENNKWMIDTYFNAGKSTEKIIQVWANIHCLSIDKYYTDGDLNLGEIIDSKGIMETIDIDLSKITPKYNESDWNIRGSSYRSKSRTFNFWKNDILYIIPVIEIVRAVLAPNEFMLNTILYNDVFEDYYTYEFENRMLNLFFTSQYKTTYLKDNYYNHLAWIISNNNILMMINTIGYNMLNINKMIFDFDMPSFKIQARVKKNKVGYTVAEIIKFKEKEIKIDEFKIYHPSFEEQENSNRTKLRTYVKLSKDSDRSIDNDVDGSTKSDESIIEELISHEYINIPKIRREKTGHRNKRTDEDENTKKYIIKDDKSRTFSDGDGFNLAKGIEISNVDIDKVNGQLKEFIEVLNRLRTMNGIKSVEIKIVELPLGRRFSYLGDSITRRMCLIASLMNHFGREYKIIEVEREEKSLSTLILSCTSYLDWENTCKIILKGLVNESGKWSNQVFDLLEREHISIKRHRHLDKKIYEKTNDI